MKWFLFIFSLMLSSCALLKKVGNDDIYYMHEMKLDVNGKKGVGFLVLPEVYEYRIGAKWDHAVSALISIRSCRIDDVIRPKKGIFKKGDRKLEYRYNRSVMELGHHCPLMISAFDDKGRHTFGAIYFQGGDEVIKGRMTCNKSVDEWHKGVSVCQSHIGLDATIMFEKELDYEVEEGCPELTHEDLGNQHRYEYEVGKGECVYVFYDEETDTFHRHVSYGYTDYHLR
jgi:hypothetical protein